MNREIVVKTAYSSLLYTYKTIFSQFVPYQIHNFIPSFVHIKTTFAE